MRLQWGFWIRTTDRALGLIDGSVVGIRSERILPFSRYQLLSRLGGHPAIFMSASQNATVLELHPRASHVTRTESSEMPHFRKQLLCRERGMASWWIDLRPRTSFDSSPPRGFTDSIMSNPTKCNRPCPIISLTDYPTSIGIKTHRPLVWLAHWYMHEASRNMCEVVHVVLYNCK